MIFSHLFSKLKLSRVRNFIEDFRQFFLAGDTTTRDSMIKLVYFGLFNEYFASPDPLHVHDDGLLLGEDVVVLQLVLEVHPHCGRGHFKVFIKINSPPMLPAPLLMMEYPIMFYSFV